MRLCIFEDKSVAWLEPLTLTRPAFDLWCGAASLRLRQQRAVGADLIGALVRPDLVELCQLQHPAMAVNDPLWMQKAPTVFVNARWLPPVMPLADVTTPHVGLVNDQVAYFIPTGPVENFFDSVDYCLESLKHTLPCQAVGGALLEYPWDLVDHNADALCQDLGWFSQTRKKCRSKPQITVVGPADLLVVDSRAEVEPGVMADTRNGPVLIDRGAVIQAFTRLEGPCYVGEGSWLLGPKLRGGSTIGPACRIGGEVEASIVQGCSNKYHDGFLGHSYVGAWVNLAAGTQVSDLRNDYGPIKVTINGERLPTGRTKVGSFIGDHTKTGLGALLNTGSAIGPFCNLLPTGSLLPTVVPPFCELRHGQVQEITDLRRLLQASATVMGRRGQEFTEVHRDYYLTLFEKTASRRQKILREGDIRRLRLSV